MGLILLQCMPEVAPTGPPGISARCLLARGEADLAACDPFSRQRTRAEVSSLARRDTLLDVWMFDIDQRASPTPGAA